MGRMVFWLALWFCVITILCYNHGVKKLKTHLPSKNHPMSPMTTNFECYIRQICRQKNLSLEQLSAMAGFTRGTLYNIFASDNPKISQLIALSSVLGVHHYDLIRLTWNKFAPISAANQPSDAGGFLDETIPDGTLIAPASVFEKTWTIQNIGDVAWVERYFLQLDAPYRQDFLAEHSDGADVHDYQFVAHEKLIALPTIAAGEIYTLKATYTAPKVTGRYISYWRMVDKHGRLCFPNSVALSVSILVRGFGASV